ncbi:MAG: SDR family oxidoreductase [Rhodobacteraceae bacterium]|jgi:NAD(P)-dependent dehydrogenase (short-subunit alcohol dehydrogenase family)|nr:SDR family oxidoreductase [Paracoccaceae bacterium]
MGEFEGRIVVITGAAHGIGRAMALGFAAEGADVALLDRDGAALEATAGDARGHGRRVLAIEADLLDHGVLVESFARIARDLGPAHTLVNNLGQTARERFSMFSDAPHEVLEFVLDISLHAAIHCSRQVVGAMKDRREGRIVSISSDSAFNGDLGCVDYAAAKAGVLGFTRGLAREMAPYGVTVNAICPGPTNTRAMQRIPPDAFERARAAVPMQAICEPEDIANAAIFLASSKARFITGNTLIVNGGRVFH